jgi:hypothetical protein
LFCFLGGDITLLEKESYFAKIFSRPVAEDRKRKSELVGEMTMASFKMQLE